jgi:WD40 repeat protein
MNRKWILFILIFTLTISSLSCGFSVDLGTTPPTKTVVLTTSAPTSTSAPSSTPESATQAAEGTSTPEEVVPAAAPSPTPLPPPQVISAGNAASLTFKRGYGLGSLQKMKVSPDGKTALLSYSARLILMNLNDLSVIWKIDPGRLLWDVTFSKDGSHLISASLGGTVQIWDAASGSLLSTTIPQKKGVHDVALSEYGEYFAILDFKDVTTIWDTASGKQVQDNNGVANPGGINTIRLSPGGGTLLIDGIDSAMNKQVQQWKVTDGTYKIGLLGLMQEMSNWEFSPDANRIFGINHRSLTANRSTVLTAWNANNGALIKTFDSVGLITRYLVSPDGATILASTEDNVIHILNVETGKEKGSFTGHASEIAAMGFSPDSQGVISIDVSGKIILWDIVNQKDIKSIDGFYVSPNSPVVFSTNGKLAALLSPDMKSIGVLDTSTMQPVQKVGPEQKNLDHLAISPAGSYVAACDEQNRIIIWEAATGKKVQMIEAKTRFPIYKMKFSPDEKIITTLNAGQIFIWDVATGVKQKELAGYNDFDFSPVEKIIASDSMDFNLYFTDVDTGKKLSTVKGEYNNSITYSPNGRFIAVGGMKNQLKERGLNNLVFQIDTHSKERLPVEMQEIPGLVTETAYNPNMDLLATRDQQGNVQIWDLRDGKLVALFEEISMSPGGLTFNQDGSILFVGGNDGTIGIISTSGAAANAPAATEPGAAAVPELSDQPYTHSSGAMTVTLPKDWKVEERGNLSFKAADPTGLGQIIANITNTIKPLSDESFVNLINNTEERFLSTSQGLKEIDKKVDAPKGTAFVTFGSSEPVIIEMYFTRVDAVVSIITFVTAKQVVETYLPVYQGIFASFKINNEYVLKQLPYGCIDNQDPAGKFAYCIPFGWSKSEGNQSTGSNISASAPDGSAALSTEIIPLKAGENPTDDQIFILLVTALQKQGNDLQVIRKDKTTSGNWQVTYNLSSKAENGVIIATRIDSSLQTLNVTYETNLEKQYKPLVNLLITSLKKK